MQISESDHCDSDLTENQSDYNTPHHKISRFSILISIGTWENRGQTDAPPVTISAHAERNAAIQASCVSPSFATGRRGAASVIAAAHHSSGERRHRVYMRQLVVRFCGAGYVACQMVDGTVR